MSTRSLVEDLNRAGLSFERLGIPTDTAPGEIGARNLEEVRMRVQMSGGKAKRVKLKRGSSADRAASRRSKMKHKGTARAYERKMKKLAASGRMTKSQKAVARFKAARGMGEGLELAEAVFAAPVDALNRTFAQLSEPPAQLEELHNLAGSGVAVNAETVAAVANCGILANNLSEQYRTLHAETEYHVFEDVAEMLQGVVEEATTAAKALNLHVRAGTTDKVDTVACAELLREHVGLLVGAAAGLEEFDAIGETVIAEMDAMSDDEDDEDEDEDEYEDDEDDEDDECDEGEGEDD